MTKRDKYTRLLEQEVFAMPEVEQQLTDDQYTDYCTGADGTEKQPYPRQRNRQCSIGYHSECSDPNGQSCGCPCHRIPRKRFNELLEEGVLS